jgi:predicted nuclease of predicted toxin-antitoxin system
MKFLLDMGISPRTGEFLRSLGHEALHLLEERLNRLSDPEIFQKARDEGSIILTHDLDFADLVAGSGARLPSVVVFRLESMRPENVDRHVRVVIEQYGETLEEGAVVSVTERRIRIRSLPFEISGRPRRDHA